MASSNTDEKVVEALRTIAVGARRTVRGNLTAISRREITDIAREACDALGIEYSFKDHAQVKTTMTFVWVKAYGHSDLMPQIIHDLDDGLVGPKVKIVAQRVLSGIEEDLPLAVLAKMYPAPRIEP